VTTSTRSTVQAPELDALRLQVRRFLAAELAAGRIRSSVDSWLTGWDEEFSARLGEQGWIGMTIPTEYGGGGLPSLHRYAVIEELLVAGAPVAAHWFADRQVAPGLLRHGSEELRRRYLPAIAAGRCYWAIGLSEPDSGSDLASVRTSATQVPGGWRISGTKVWTSGAHHAHAILVLARSAPSEANRHAGLSQFIVAPDQAGVTVRPILLMNGAHHFNEVVLEDVFVPDAMVLGAVGDGWRQVTSELAHERSGPERFLSTYVLLVALLEHLSWRGPGSLPPAAAATVGRLISRLWTLRHMSLAVAATLDGGSPSPVAAALVKDVGTRLEGEIVTAARQLGGVAPDPDGTGFPRLLADAVLQAPGFTLRGGTNEILRGVVARSLGAA
jgi:acyl-CoA dehydrogenase